jgi:O-antigen/teichoic acid export membrane protein
VDSYRKFARAILSVGSLTLLIALRDLILLSLLTKAIGAHDYGLWCQVQVTFEIMAFSASLGLPYAMTRFMASMEKREEIQELFNSVFLTALLSAAVITILLVVFSSFIARAFFEGIIRIVIITAFIALLSVLDNTCLSYFRSFQRMGAYSIAVVSRSYGEIILVAFLVLAGYAIYGVLIAVLVARSVSFIVLYFLVRSQLGFKWPCFTRVRECLDFSLPLISSNISGWILTSADRFVISYFLGATAVGVYSAGYYIGSIPLGVSALLTTVLLPRLSKSYDENEMNEVKTYMGSCLRYSLAIIIPFVCQAALLSKQLLLMFANPEVAAQGSLVVPIIALSTLFYGVQAVIGFIIELVKKTRISGVIWAISALVNLGLDILVVPISGIWGGINGAALTTLVTYALAMVLTVYFSFREFKFDIGWQFIIKCLAASSIMSLVVWLIQPQGTVATILTIIAGTVVYTIVLIFLKGLWKNELEFLKNLLPGH